jgi:1-aminocyclopropane-1-carboxylate deaminase
LSKNGNPIIKDADIDWALVPQTRVHGWRFDGHHSHQVFIKREDEARFGMTGGKQRKLASIIPWLRAQSISTVALAGSANSNNVLSAAILLRERFMDPIPLIKQGRFEGTNQFLLSLLVDRADWRMIESSQWPHIEKIGSEFVEECASRGIRAAFIPEGACMPEALPGAMTLATDILRNEKEMGFAFDDIFIDAGTGLSAAALVLGLHRFGKPGLEEGRSIHVTLMADTEEVFMEKFKQYCQWYEAIYEEQLPSLVDRIVLHTPAFAASYGSVNAGVIDSIRQYAKRGVFTDPIYSAKHFATVDRYLDELIGKEMILGLVIHSGGAQALPGFERMFAH